MEIEELDTKLKDLQKQYNKSKTVLLIRYANANNPHKVGDIIEDHYHIIKIESWKTTTTYGKPCLVYIGIELKKDLKPKKRQSNTNMYQPNVKRKLND